VGSQKEMIAVNKDECLSDSWAVAIRMRGHFLFKSHLYVAFLELSQRGRRHLGRRRRCRRRCQRSLLLPANHVSIILPQRAICKKAYTTELYRLSCLDGSWLFHQRLQLSCVYDGEDSYNSFVGPAFLCYKCWRMLKALSIARNLFVRKQTNIRAPQVKDDFPSQR
jgi:hypothetical protein